MFSSVKFSENDSLTDIQVALPDQSPLKNSAYRKKSTLKTKNIDDEGA